MCHLPHHVLHRRVLRQVRGHHVAGSRGRQSTSSTIGGPVHVSGVGFGLDGAVFFVLLLRKSHKLVCLCATGHDGVHRSAQTRQIVLQLGQLALFAEDLLVDLHQRGLAGLEVLIAHALPLVRDLRGRHSAVLERVAKHAAGTHVLVALLRLTHADAHAVQVVPIVAGVAAYHLSVVQVSAQAVSGAELRECVHVLLKVHTNGLRFL
mmetsp:Transcript_20719/g.28521  ORF Transcript_20719/g.28521 Transcript_20719/m.28521 type:complete len:207 (+) Transcript_20719:1322-1942(+)